MVQIKEIAVKLPDRTVKKIPSGSTALDLANLISPGLAQQAAAAYVNRQLVDLKTVLNDGDEVEIVKLESPVGLDVLRHSTAHVMAQAVTELYPEVKLGIGPTIQDGFYYDFELPVTLSDHDLANIEKKMQQIIKRKTPFIRQELSKAEAIKLFSQQDQPFKVEVIEELGQPAVTTYQQDSFIDLCRGPHLPHTGKIKAFKLLKVAGAYWRGDEKRPMLTRIYGTAWPTKEELNNYLNLLEEAKKRDHRLLGQQLDLFHINEEVGAGLVLWHPKGALLRYLIEEYWRQVHLENGYDLVMIPHLANLLLWQTSGHWEFYRENMFSPIDVENQKYIVKPMNCPLHIQIYKFKPRSYKELPLRWAELGTVYRYERSGVLHGLLRVRGFTQDDAHIFCRQDQILSEVKAVLKLVQEILPVFGFTEFDIYLSTRPEKYVGTLEKWELATEALKTALEEANLPYAIDPGEGVFYGPKIDIKIKDALGRAWQCTTIQVDFNLPERFSLTYKGEDNLDHQPILIHRAILGSLERFIGCLIEHYAGAFPLWLAPVQAVIIPIADRHIPYAEKVGALLKREKIRVEIDSRRETVSKKIRDQQLQKVPYMLVVGDKEAEAEKVALRRRDGKDFGALDIHLVQAKLKKEITEKLVRPIDI